MLTEYLEVVARPELVRKFKALPSHMRDLLDLLSQAEIVFLSGLPRFDRDPDDAHVLATAAQGKVDYLISSDNDLLDLGDYEGIPILPAGAFLRQIETQGNPR